MRAPTLYTLLGSLLATSTVVAAGGCTDPSANHAPDLVTTSVTTPRDTPVVLPIQHGDPDRDPLLFSLSTPQHGQVEGSGANWRYVPAPGYVGSDEVVVTASDGAAERQATIAITVTAVNYGPVAVADHFSIDEDHELRLAASALADNDSDPDGDALSVTAVSGAYHGQVSLVGGLVVFTPDADYHGPAGFTYQVSDGQLAKTALVELSVGGIADPPVALDDALATDEDAMLVIAPSLLTANDSDRDGDTVVVIAVGDASSGSVELSGGQISYLPAPDFHGAATFSYDITDGSSTTRATVAVAVASVNDAPVAADDVIAIDEDTTWSEAASALLANDVDVDGDALQVIAVGDAIGGSVELVAGQVTFQPAANFHGAAQFRYAVSDGQATATATAWISVDAVNDAPVVPPAVAQIDEDTQLTRDRDELLAGASDADGDQLSITGAELVAGGGSVIYAHDKLVYTPAANFHGIAAITFLVSDGTIAVPGLLTVDVASVNDAPIASADPAATTEDVALILSAGDLLANDSDVDGDPLLVVGVGEAAHGVVELAGDQITFTPDEHFHGSASFRYMISDGAATASNTVTIAVAEVIECGDGETSGEETCDDGNTDDGDGCDASCASEETRSRADVLHYRFDDGGTESPRMVRNEATSPPAGTEMAQLMGGWSQADGGQCDGALIGSGVSGTTDYVETFWPYALDNSFTISFWTKDIAPSSQLYYLLGEQNLGSFRMFTNGVAGATNWILRGNGITDVLIPGGATTAPKLTTIVWDATALTFTGYVDGALVVTTPQAGPLSLTSSATFRIGKYGTNTGLPAGGKLDEFRLYGRALTATEINELFVETSTCPL